MNNGTNNPADHAPVDGNATPRRQVRFAESFGTPELEDSPSTTPPSSPAVGNDSTDTPVGFTVGPAAFAIGTPSPAPRRPRARQAAQEAQVLARFAGLRPHGPSGPVNTTPTIQRRRVITEPLRHDRVPLATVATMGTVALTTSRNANVSRRVSAPIRPFVDVDEEEDDNKPKRNVRRRRGRKLSCGGYPGFTVYRDPEDDDDNKENIPPPMAPMLGRIR